MTLDEIAKRLETAQGPDRGLDGLIARDIEGWIPHFDLEGDDLLDWHECGGHWHRPETHPNTRACKARSDSYRGFEGKCPAYTASLDSALALVERVRPGWLSVVVGVKGKDGSWAQLVRNDHVYTSPEVTARAATPALAALLALIRSIEGEKTNDE